MFIHAEIVIASVGFNADELGTLRYLVLPSNEYALPYFPDATAAGQVAVAQIAFSVFEPESLATKSLIESLKCHTAINPELAGETSAANICGIKNSNDTNNNKLNRMDIKLVRNK
ncbi:MAG: hypothetical protein NUV57_02860 [archaeon]|nr:hypothetical protein [archaeon]